MSAQIMVYITGQKERVISGDPLVLLMPPDEREIILADLEKALHANTVQLKNGDHMLVSRG